MKATKLAPLPLYLIAHLVKCWSLLLARAPFLTKLGLYEPQGPCEGFAAVDIHAGRFYHGDSRRGEKNGPGRCYRV